MDIQWPLVLFSLVAGTGGSLFAFVGLSELLGGSDKTRDAGAACSAVLLALGGCLSVLHLAAPLHAISAVTNLLSFSGISIELMLLGANFAIMVAYLLVRRRSKATAPLRVLSVLGIVLGLMLGYFCGHGYVIEGQPTWNSETLPLAYLGSSLACGAFLFALISALKGEGDELGGKLNAAVTVAAAVNAAGLASYCLFLGGNTTGHEAILWGGVVAIGAVATLAVSVVALTKKASVSPAVLAGVGLACAFVGGVSVRVLMWVCSTGFIDLFSCTVPSVMLNL